MRCSHCGSSWNTLSNTTVLFCPFCGEALVSLPDTLTDFEEVLSYLVTTYGKQILSNQQTVFRFIEKCLPDAKKESAFLRYAYASGIMDQICRVDAKDANAVDSVRKRSFYILTSDYGISEEWAKYIVFSILKCIGISEQGEDTSAVYIQRKAERNDPAAQYTLAQMFLDGKDVRASSEKYIYWLSRASQNGLEKATFELVRCYVDGTVCTQDLAAATTLIKSILTSVPDAAIYAINNIESLSLSDNDIFLALRTVEDSSDEIGLCAYMALAGYYAKIAQDNEKALIYAKKAYDISPAEAWEIYCQQLQLRNAVGDIPLSVKVMKDAVNDGSSSAAFELAEKHRLGNGVPQNYTIALSWYKIAANAGNTLAEYQLGTFFEYGLGVDKDIDQAVYWYKRAAYAGCSAAQEKVNYRTSTILKEITLQFEDDTELSCPVDGIFDFDGNSYMIVRDPESTEIIAFGYKEVHTIDGFELSNLDDATHERVIKAYRHR